MSVVSYASLEPENMLYCHHANHVARAGTCSHDLRHKVCNQLCRHKASAICTPQHHIHFVTHVAVSPSDSGPDHPSDAFPILLQTLRYSMPSAFRSWAQHGCTGRQAGNTY